MRFAIALVLTVSGISACSGDEGDDNGSLEGSGGTGNVISVGGKTGVPVTGGSNGTGTGGSNGTGTGGTMYMLPDDFEEANYGGWKLGERVPPSGTAGMGGSGMSDGCGAEIIGIVRDFKRGNRDGGHPDFETFTGNGEQGIVEDELGEDQKPVHAEGDHEFTTTEANFNQWYRTEEGVNEAYFVSFYLEPNDNVLTFFSNAFFPLDDEGFGNENAQHNYHFTTEVHTTFKYNGGETFSFTGDDDLWVFINKRLAIDLGGLHPSMSDQISLDAEASRLGITRGNVYTLDLFHAERHTDQSNFRIDTNLYFVDCGIIVPDEPVR